MGEKIERWAPTLVALLLALLAAVFFFGGLNQGQTDLKERIAGVDADLKERIAGVDADLKERLAGVDAGLKERIAGVKADVAAMETRMVALFADQLRDQRRDVADVRERVSALEAAGS